MRDFVSEKKTDVYLKMSKTLLWYDFHCEQNMNREYNFVFLINSFLHAGLPFTRHKTPHTLRQYSISANTKQNGNIFFGRQFTVFCPLLHAYRIYYIRVSCVCLNSRVNHKSLSYANAQQTDIYNKHYFWKKKNAMWNSGSGVGWRR